MPPTTRTHHPTGPPRPPGDRPTRPTRRNPPRVSSRGLSCVDDLSAPAPPWRHTPRIPTCRLTCTDEVFGKRRVTDLTMVPTREGPLWLSAIRDAFSRRVVAWETSARADADLVLTTLEYALASREVEPGTLIHHADHGCQYTSIKLTTRLVRAGIEASMGSVGDSYDNALAENLWMLIKTECIRGRAFATRAEANLALFEYIDGFYNPRRIQKRLGYLSPIEFEEKHYANQATAEPVNLKPRKPALTS
ncbi:IS3 family transposase [Streptomyces sp. 2MCAF27]